MVTLNGTTYQAIQAILSINEQRYLFTAMVNQFVFGQGFGS